MWQFIVGVLVGGTVGFFLAALILGENAYRNERCTDPRPEESNHPRNS